MVENQKLNSKENIEKRKEYLCSISKMPDRMNQSDLRLSKSKIEEESFT